MRGLKIIIDGQVSYLPYNRQTIALYEERNNVLKNSIAGQKEFATIMEMSEDEVTKYLYAAPVNTRPIPQAQNSMDITSLMQLVLSQQAAIAEMQKQLSTHSAVVEAPQVKPKQEEIKAKTGTKKATGISLDKPVTDAVPELEIVDDLQDFQ